MNHNHRLGFRRNRRRRALWIDVETILFNVHENRRGPDSRNGGRGGNKGVGKGGSSDGSGNGSDGSGGRSSGSGSGNSSSDEDGSTSRGSFVKGASATMIKTGRASRNSLAAD